jgi:light-regulated signal transduction histidine kinase (bacteriophytochrome)
MTSLIDDLLALSQLSRATLQRGPVSLSKIARTVLDELGHREPGRQVTVEIEPNLEAVGDGRLVTILLENVLGNAWKFTSKKPDPRIQVGRAGTNGHRAFFVRDNGAGFDMAYADRLFQPFNRLHQRTEFEGAASASRPSSASSRAMAVGCGPKAPSARGPPSTSR